MKAVTTSLFLFATASILVAQTEPVVTPAPGPPPAPPAAPAVTTTVVASPPVVTTLISSTDLAVQNALRRQMNQKIAREKLEQARAAELRRDLETAAKLYGEAWALADSVGPQAETERQIAAA